MPGRERGESPILRDIAERFPQGAEARLRRGMRRWGRTRSGQVSGHFDGHGGNLAFDHGAAVLNGICDFADSGSGPLHRAFIYCGLVSADLPGRLMAQDAALSGKGIDRERLAVLVGLHRLWKLAKADQDKAQVARFGDWVAGR